MTETPSHIEPLMTELKELQRNHLFRVMPDASGMPGPIININGIHAINFSGNNYLGLAGHPALISGAVQYAQHYGAGSTASRLIAGNGEAHRELESFIAAWKGTEAALLFVSGYQANVGALSSIAGKEDLILSDQLNHASIIDGCRLSRAKVEVYPHLDLNRLEELLRQKGFRRKVVVTESVFSMDGHQAPLADISTLCREWGAMLMVDEAHATGVFGPRGQGLAAELGIVPDIQMGTLGKAVGSAGAYIAGTKLLIQLLVNRARSLIYTTATPPSVLGAALAGLNIIASEEGRARRHRLHANAREFARLLTSAYGHPCGGNHIVPILIGESAGALRVSQTCLERGVFAQGIRFPTVPEGTARLRFTLMSDHRSEDLRKAVTVLAEATDAERERSNRSQAASGTRLISRERTPHV